MKSILITTVLGALGAGTLVLSATASNAAVVCNKAGECWHADNRMKYREPGIVVHPDTWYFHRDWDHDKDYRWRAENHHRDRGFWRNGVWITF
jgi:hypothetical protein